MGQSILPKMTLPSTTDSEDTEVFIFTFLFHTIIFNICLFFEYRTYIILSPNLKETILFCRMMYLINLLVRKGFVTIYKFFCKNKNLHLLKILYILLDRAIRRNFTKEKFVARLSRRRQSYSQSYGAKN